jgi:hypothetical protein
MRILSILLFSLLVTGCEARVSAIQVETAIKLCKDNGGLKQVNTQTFFNIINPAICNDGAEYPYSIITLNKGNKPHEN